MYVNAEVLISPIQPARVGNYSFIGCWTDEKDDRTLSSAGSSGAIDVDTCASFCDDYQYMGTEYSKECQSLAFIPRCPVLAMEPLDDIF